MWESYLSEFKKGGGVMSKERYLSVVDFSLLNGRDDTGKEIFRRLKFILNQKNLKYLSIPINDGIPLRPNFSKDWVFHTEVTVKDVVTVTSYVINTSGKSEKQKISSFNKTTGITKTKEVSNER